MNINYPFNRILKDSVFSSSEDKLTITGQLIAPAIIRDITSGEYEYSDLKMCSLNPQLSEASYLMRYALETLSDQSFSYLCNDKKRSSSEMLRAAQVIREEIWDSWDICAKTATSEDISPSDYYTGSQKHLILVHGRQ